jgi:hypothetical protein
MAVPAGYIDMNAATQVAGRNRNFIAAAAREGKIPGAFQFGTSRTAPWYFTVEGLRQWMGVPAGERVSA